MRSAWNHLSAAMLLVVLCAASGALALAATADLLGIPGPISLHGQTYELAWSKRFSDNYARHEYVPRGETVQSYRHMLLIDRVDGTDRSIDVANVLVEQLKKRKEQDPFVNFEIFHNPEKGEVIVDFVMRDSTRAGDGLVEWNLYRYAPVRDSDGRPAVLLLGLSERAYGDDRIGYMKGLKERRAPALKALIAAPLPQGR